MQRMVSLLLVIVLQKKHIDYSELNWTKLTSWSALKRLCARAASESAAHVTPPGCALQSIQISTEAAFSPIFLTVFE